MRCGGRPSAGRIAYRVPVTSPSSRRLIAPCVGLVLLSATLVGCGSSQAAPSASPKPSAKPSASPEARSSKLSGRNEKDGPVLAVKLDNSRAALPHMGLTSADVVYVQQVEGGISRLAALYSTRYPTTVAPVRSARETDAELLPQYGQIPLGFSGSTNTVHSLVRKAGLVDVSEDVSGKGFFRIGARNAPHDLGANPTTLVERAGKRPAAQRVGFTFARKAPAGGRAATSATAAMPAARIGFTYRTATGRYDVSLDGRSDRTPSEGQVAASTVVIQAVPVSYLSRVDTSGARVPLTRTVGRGKATVLRDGKAWSVTWSRPSASKPTKWTYKGKDFPMKAGQMWIVLLDNDRSPRIK